MSAFESMARYGHEQLVFWSDPSAGLEAIIAIHSTVLGPSLGGCRMHPYAREHDALEDVLRLSRGMTYKAAVAGVALGGGKSVIIGNPDTDKSEDLLRSFGRFVETLKGRYTASEDIGTNMWDLAVMAAETDHVASDYTGAEGDMNFLTALGTYEGMRAAVEHALGLDSLAGLTVAVQGLGHVGLPLCGLLRQAGARLLVADVRPDLVESAVAQFDAEAVDPEAILNAPCDVFAPCAMGAVLDDRTIPALRCRVVAGSANNALAEPEHGRLLHGRGIILAPDYVINGGGLIAEASRLEGLDFTAARQRVMAVHGNVDAVLDLAERGGIAPSDAADRYAEERLAAAGGVEAQA